MRLRVLCLGFLATACTAMGPRDALVVEPGDLASAVSVDGSLKISFTLLAPTPGTVQTLRDALLVVQAKDGKALDHELTETSDESETRLEVTLAEPPDEWVFAGFRELPQKVEHALARMESRGVGIRVRPTHGPTPRVLRLCGSEVGASGFVEFSEPVTVAEPTEPDLPSPMDLSVDVSGCVRQARQGGNGVSVPFACPTNTVHMVRLVIRGGVRSTEGGELMELVDGTTQLTRTFSADDGAQRGGCLEWRLQ